jgi:hypothetical protein
LRHMMRFLRLPFTVLILGIFPTINCIPLSWKEKIQFSTGFHVCLMC